MSTTTEKQKGYANGYNAGKKANATERDRLAKENVELKRKLFKAEQSQIDNQKERIYMQSLEMVLMHCGSSKWTIGGKTVDNAKMYCKLAKSFADNSIAILKQT